MPEISDQNVKLKSSRLKGKSIAFGICGGIGAVESVKLIRELRRHEAEITAFFTPDASKFITPLSVQWACNRPVIEHLGADTEHLMAFDLLIIAPVTLNSIAKMVVGIADNALMQLFATQIGARRKVLVFPTMNIQMTHHPVLGEHLETLKKWGVKVVFGPEEEGRWKMPDAALLSSCVIEELGGGLSREVGLEC